MKDRSVSAIEDYQVWFPVAIHIRHYYHRGLGAARVVAHDWQKAEAAGVRAAASCFPCAAPVTVVSVASAMSTAAKSILNCVCARMAISF